MTVSRPQLHLLHSYVFGAIRVLNSAGYVRRRSGPGHHGKATNRIGSMGISLSGISLAGLLTFLLVMRLNVGYNNNIFLCHGGKVRSVFVKSPHFYHSKVHVVGFLQHFEIERTSNCEIHRLIIALDSSRGLLCHTSLSKK